MAEKRCVYVCVFVRWKGGGAQVDAPRRLDPHTDTPQTGWLVDNAEGGNVEGKVLHSRKRVADTPDLPDAGAEVVAAELV